MIIYNLEKGKRTGETLFNIFKSRNIDYEKLLSDSKVSVPEGSTFYDKTIEQVWGDLLGFLKKQ